MSQEGGVFTAAFAPMGRTLLTVGEKGRRLWDAANGKPIGPAMSQEGGVFTAAFSPDGRTLLTTNPREARLWDAATGRPIGAPDGPMGVRVRDHRLQPRRPLRPECG